MGPSVRERWTIVYFSNGLTHKIILPYVGMGVKHGFLLLGKCIMWVFEKNMKWTRKMTKKPEVNVEFGILQDREYCDLSGYVVLLG